MYQQIHLRQILSLIFMTALLFVVTACAPANDELAGTKWHLVSYGPAGNPTPTLANTEVTLEFAEGKAAGSSGCNQYGGNYEVDGGKLMISDVFQTMMACMDEDVMKQEAAFTTALTAAQSFALEGNNLTITYDGGVLHFAPVQPIADQTFEGTRWQLVTFTTGEIAHSLVSGTEITAQFVNGQVNGTAGCNQYFADYTLEGEQITIGAVGATKVACAEEIMAQESEFLTALETAESFRVDGIELTLVHPGGALIFSAGEVEE